MIISWDGAVAFAGEAFAVRVMRHWANSDVWRYILATMPHVARAYWGDPED